MTIATTALPLADFATLMLGLTAGGLLLALCGWVGALAERVQHPPNPEHDHLGRALERPAPAASGSTRAPAAPRGCR